ncbi:NAD-dependent epimerase/dehydratase family protein [Silvanigrella aquatica]|uniref:NAD-dependent epimerase/dehydratase domain-containing protein n=1 Tax=Silvanigrella aquatica TaxID=1915309 RepID=A0A1L4D327_9BACT|nr:SDR family oxidoreductase [Silvanigrella aquatica]APJ04592.1 hypothetical protein AXG55_12020 [Silvanigrella aquatica]
MENKKMKVLVTGAGGYLGTQIVSYLDQTNFYSLRLLTSKIDLIEKLNLINSEVVSVPFFEISDFTNICDGIEMVIHLSALDNKECLENPSFAIYFNITQTMRLIAAASQLKIKRFIYMSTIHVYGNALKKKTDNDRIEINENTLTEPLTTYAITHKSAEDFILSICSQNGIEGCILRLSNSFGYPYNINNLSGCKLLVNELCNQSVIDKKLVLKSGGKAVLNFMPVSSICYLISEILKANFSVHGIFNLGSNTSLSIYEMAKLVAKRCLLKFNYEPEITIPTHFKNSQITNKQNDFYYSNEKIKKFGFLNNLDLEKEIDLTILQFFEYNKLRNECIH